MVGYLVSTHDLSIRRSCQALNLSRSVYLYHYQPDTTRPSRLCWPWWNVILAMAFASRLSFCDRKGMAGIINGCIASIAN